MTEQSTTSTVPAAVPEVTVGQMRVQTMRGLTYFYVSKRTTMEAMKADIDELMGKVAAARAAAHIEMDGPYVFTYYIMGGDMSTFEMRIGFPVPAGTQAAGGAQVVDLGEFRCASLVYCGSLQHISRACEELMQAMRREGLTPLAESREWYLYFEDGGSANNVTMLQEAI